MKEGRRGVRLVAASVAMVVGGAVLVPHLGGIASGGTAQRTLERQLDRLRHASGAYHNEKLAIAGGFERDDQCVSSPQGGMGYHYVDRERFDAVVDKDQPEALLYAPAGESRRVLTGVEYLKVDENQDLATDDDRPTLFGRPFAGPGALPICA